MRNSQPAPDPAAESSSATVFRDVEEFTAFIDRGAARLTPRDVHRLVAEMPEVREKIPTLDEVGFSHARGQLAFLADLVESFVLQHEQDLPYRAALDAAFALHYFHRDIDLIPDSLGAIGYIDDAAVVATVLARHRDAFAVAARKLRHHWPALGIDSEPS